MEAKESVTVDNICEIHNTVKGIYCWECIYRAGIKEAVEWVNNEVATTQFNFSRWQTKLKEWEIK